MKTESIRKRRHLVKRIVDAINNVVTFINAVGIAFLALSLLNIQSQIKTLFDREGDTAIKVDSIEKALDIREKLFADHVEWSHAHIKHRHSSTNTVDKIVTPGDEQ